MAWTRDDAKVIREMVKQEGDGTNHRITWMVTLQGLLFAALRFAWKDGEACIPALLVLGLFSSISSLFALSVAHMATATLIDRLEKYQPEDYDGPDVIGYF